MNDMDDVVRQGEMKIKTKRGRSYWVFDVPPIVELSNYD